MAKWSNPTIEEWIAELPTEYSQDTPGVPPKYYQSIPRVLPEYYQSTTRVLPEYSQSTTRVLPEYYQSIPKVLPEYYQSTTRVLPEYSQSTTRVLPVGLVKLQRRPRRIELGGPNFTMNAVRQFATHFGLALFGLRSAKCRYQPRWCDELRVRLLVSHASQRR